MSYRVRLAFQAELQGLEITEWWEANRPKAPGLFDEEIAKALAYLVDAPHSGFPLRGRHRGLRRLVLHKTRYHLYYNVDEERREVEIVAIWHTSKGKGPPL